MHSDRVSGCPALGSACKNTYDAVARTARKIAVRQRAHTPYGERRDINPLTQCAVGPHMHSAVLATARKLGVVCSERIHKGCLL